MLLRPTVLFLHPVVVRNSAEWEVSQVANVQDAWQMADGRRCIPEKRFSAPFRKTIDIPVLSCIMQLSGPAQSENPDSKWYDSMSILLWLIPTIRCDWLESVCKSARSDADMWRLGQISRPWACSSSSQRMIETLQTTIRSELPSQTMTPSLTLISTPPRRSSHHPAM